MNLVECQAAANGVTLPSGLSLELQLPAAGADSGARARTVGIRASSLHVQRRDGDLGLPGTVELAEISGSDTFVHVGTGIGEVVAQLPGVHQFTLGAPIMLHLSPAQVFVFDEHGRLLFAPREARSTDTH